MISVVAPCLNEQKHLPTFLNSLLNQTYKDFELIVVDGGSKDRSREIIRRFRSKLLTKGVDVRIIVDSRRNLGYIRNVGGVYAKGDITIQCNTDNYFEPELLRKINRYYQTHNETVSLSGRVYPLGNNLVAHIGYQLFDLLRYLFTRMPYPLRKYRPSGNFTTFQTEAWMNIRGYPEAPVNEDGLLGEKLDNYVRQNGGHVVFKLNLYVGHYVKKFEQMGGVTALLFYFYTLGNFSSVLKTLLKPVEFSAARVFQGKQRTESGLGVVLNGLWNWL